MTLDFLWHSTVPAYLLASHLKICNDKKIADQWSSEPYHVPSINAGPEPALILPDAPPELADFKGRVDTPACRRLAYAVNLGPDALKNLISRLNSVSKRIKELSPNKYSILREEDVEKLAARASTGSSHMPFNVKHGAQHASILGNMDKFGLFSHPKDTMFIEFGAGKGYLTNALAKLIPEADKLIMMDNQKFKLLADRRLRNKKMQRLRCDIANFEPCGVDGFEQVPFWVAHGKHLCGAATDLTLRCCYRYLERRRERGGGGGGTTTGDAGSSADTVQVVDHKSTFLGLGVATCCHHRCSWQHYIAQDVILELGFSPEEFEIFSYFTSWALCGHFGTSNSSTRKSNKNGKDANDSGRDNGHATCVGVSEAKEEEESIEGGVEERINGGGWRLHHSFPREERQLIGKQCKRLIDYGRVEWLRRNGFDAIEVLYCDPESSGENRLVLARPK